MDSNCVAFITCVNNEAFYSESIGYIGSLSIPQSFNVECHKVENANGMAQGYNQVMMGCNAKIKVYLHQDVFVINKNFLFDIVHIFNQYRSVGMIGVIGAKTVPPSGIWWESNDTFGKVFDSHTGKMKLLQFAEPRNGYESVRLVDGLIIATQYDIPWREDLFDGWHFYDASQSLEFIKAGYEVIIPQQEKPWVIHDSGIASTKRYAHYNEIFLKTYHEFVKS